jgi:hypothetical protein
VNAAAAFGYELRTGARDLRPSSAVLLLGGVIFAAGAGYAALVMSGHDDLAGWWLAGLAVAHLAAGVAAVRSKRVSHEIGLLTVAAGGLLADLAFGALTSGPALAAGWAASAAGLAVLVRRRREDAELTRVALGGQLMLALLHVLVFDAPLNTLGGDAADVPAALIGIGSVAITAFLCARLDSRNKALAMVFDAVAAVALGYACVASLSGAALVASFAGIAVALGSVSRREPFAGPLALAYLGLAALHALAIEAPPNALAYGVDDLAAAAAALAGVGLGGLALARQLPRATPPQLRLALTGAGAATLLYLASVAIVSVFQPGADVVDATTSLTLGVRQQGQVLLSALWAAAGVAALLLGLRTDRREPRFAGFALLGLAFGKVVMFDLATLDSIYRVASFVALGLLLLGSAFAYQRMRPHAGHAA